MRDRFRELREKQGRSQQELATLLGISASTLSGFESGRVEDFSPRIKRLLAKAYGVTIEEIEAVCGEHQRQSA